MNFVQCFFNNHKILKDYSLPLKYITYLSKAMKNHSGQIVVTDSENVWNYENNWAHGLCDCCSNLKICCFAYFCLPCFTCSIFRRTGEFLCTPFFLPASMIPLRSKLRTAFRIKGSICGDSLLTFFCPMCTAIQLYNELENQGL